MIYRALIEGGNLSLENPVDDCIYLFYSAANDDESLSILHVLIEKLMPNRNGLKYDCGNRFSTIELMEMWDNRREEYTFVNDYLVQTGLLAGIPTYVDDAIVFAVAGDRMRIHEAIKEGRKRNFAREAAASRTWAE